MTAIIGIPLLVPFVVLDNPWPLTAVMSLFAAVGVYEILKCVGMLKFPLVAIPSFITSIGAQFILRIPGYNGDKGTTAILFLFLIYALMIMMSAVFSKKAIKFTDAAVSAIMTIYISFGFTSLILLRGKEYGVILLVLAILIPWVADGAAYFVGRFFGKHKLIPDVSPKKTVEGAVGGIVGVCIITLIFGLVMHLGFGKIPNYSILLALAFVGGLLSMCGDLIASLLKREYGVKDYGHLFPGHGGVMDRFDSIISVSILMYFICWIFSASSLFVQW